MIVGNAKRCKLSHGNKQLPSFHCVRCRRGYRRPRWFEKLLREMFGYSVCDTCRRNRTIGGG